MTEEIVSEIMKDYVQQLADNGQRADGRAFDQYREVTIKTNVVTSAEGSAQVSIGNTSVIVGIKMEVGTPFPDTPDTGVLTTNAELVPMASPTFESGPPSPGSIELARVIDRGIRESQAIDMRKLCVTPKEKVWIVFIDMDILDYDGNLFDCAFLAAIAALNTAVVPASRFGIGEDYPMPIQHLPIECTFAKINKSLMLDPSLDEELIADARLTVATDENGDIRAMQKGNGGSLTLDDVSKAISMSQTFGGQLREMLRK